MTIASTDRDLGYDTMSMLKTRNFRGLYTNDVIGVEVRGAIKKTNPNPNPGTSPNPSTRSNPDPDP